MIPVVGMFRGLFLGGILVWYSNSVWKTMDNYYNQEFKKYLQREKDERRFPSEEEVCRALPNAPCTATDGDAAAATTTTAATHADAEGAAAKASRAEALGASTAPLTDASTGHEGGGAGGCTVSRDVTHTGEWSRSTKAEDSGGDKQKDDSNDILDEPEDNGDTCPARF